MVYAQLPERVSRTQLPPHSDNRNVVSQIKRCNRWLAETRQILHQPDLTSYRDLLLETLAPASVRVHLSGVRRGSKAQVENSRCCWPVGRWRRSSPACGRAAVICAISRSRTAP